VAASETRQPRSAFARRSSSPKRRTNSPRRGAGVSRQVRNAFRAACTAPRASAARSQRTRPMVSPVIGVRTRWPPSAAKSHWAMPRRTRSAAVSSCRLEDWVMVPSRMCAGKSSPESTICVRGTGETQPASRHRRTYVNPICLSPRQQQRPGRRARRGRHRPCPCGAPRCPSVSLGPRSTSSKRLCREAVSCSRHGPVAQRFATRANRHRHQLAASARREAASAWD
jgi:hypothetical protein